VARAAPTFGSLRSRFRWKLASIDPRRAYPDLEQILFRPSFAEMGAAARRHPLADIPLTVISRAIPS
jgi:hypothetical protein